jgi:hypothetical protein
VVDAALPALEYLEPGGQIRLTEVTVETVADAMLTMSGPRGAELRTEARATRVNDWSTYVDSLRNVFTRS